MKTKAPHRWQRAVACGCSLGWCEECHEELSACFLMNEVRLHDGSRSIELTFAAVLGEVSEMTETCFTNHAGRDFARTCADTCADDTAGYAIRGLPMRATRRQPGPADRRRSSPSLRRCLAVYFMSNKAMLMMDGVRAEVADAMNPDVRRHLSHDADDALTRDERSIRGETEHLILGLFWMSASSVITIWDFAFPSSIDDDRMQHLLWERWHADWTCRPIIRDDGAQSYRFHMNTPPVICGKGHESMRHGSMRPQTSAGRHDLPHEGRRRNWNLPR